MSQTLSALASRARRSAKALWPGAAERVTVAVRSGPNAGARAFAPAGRTVVARGGPLAPDPDADATFRLYAPPHEPERRLIIERDALSPLLGPLARHEECDAESRRLRGPGPHRLVVGGEVVELRRRSRPAASAAAALIAFALVAALAPSIEAALNAADAAVAAPSGAPAIAAAAPSAPHAASGETRFAERLAALGLDDAIAVRADTNGDAVVAEGRIGPNRAPAWREAVEWFDATLGERSHLINAVRIEARRLEIPFRIVAVLDAPAGRVVLDDGAAYAVGQTLPGGWRLEAVEGAAAIVTRDGDRVRLAM